MVQSLALLSPGKMIGEALCFHHGYSLFWVPGMGRLWQGGSALSLHRLLQSQVRVCRELLLVILI